MKTFANRLGRTMTLGIVMLWAAQARATPSLYTSNCASCHSTSSTTPTTCNGCHFHGEHSSTAASDINLKGSTNKTSYAPGETVTVTINAGYRTGWVRALLFDQNLKELGRSSCAGGLGGCTTSAFPVTLTATAPSAAGTYVWAVAWYGNQYDISGASFGSGNSSTLKAGFFTPDANNSGHGTQTVALPAFTVSAPQEPAIALNPTSLAFGTVNVGSSKTLTTQVQDTGTGPLNVTGISPCAGTPASISSTPPAPFTVAAAGSSTLSLTFSPTAAGALPAGACVTIASNDPAKPTINLTLSGTGATPPPPPPGPPGIASSPTSLAFGTVNVGASKMLTTQVQNTGGSTLNVTSVSACAGTPASITWTPSSAFSVPASGSTSLNVTFAPTSAGTLPAGACLTIASNDPAKPTINLALSGTGATASPPPSGPAIALNPGSLAFGTVSAGASKMLTAQVQNTGGSTLNVTRVSACSGTPGSVTWTPASAFSVPAGRSTNLNVTFAPMVAGSLPAGACLQIASNDPAKPTINLALGGSATSTAVPVIALDPASLDFGTVSVGSVRRLTVEVKNAGNARLDVTSIAHCSGTPRTLVWAATIPASIAPGASIPINVLFVPIEDGALPPGSCFRIVSSDPANPTVEVDVAGTGSTTGGAAQVPPVWGCTTSGSGWSLAFAYVAALVLLGVRKRKTAGVSGPTSSGRE